MTKNLPELKYYPDYILRIYLGGVKAWYLIPYEILNEDYLTQLEGYEYIISNYGVYIFGCRVKMWLKYITNIDDEYYYRRYILNIVDNSIIRCPICNKPKKFIRISKGYYRACDKPHSCNMLENHTYIKYPKFNNKSNINSNYIRYIHRGNLDDPCCYYIAWYRDYNWYKIGITCDYIESRTRWDKGSILHRHILITGTRLEIATLERDIKLYFNISEEYLKLSQIKEFKNVFRNKVKELNISNKFNKLDFHIK